MNHQTKEANVRARDRQVKPVREEGFYLVKYNGEITAAKFDGYWFTLCGLTLKKREHQIEQVIRELK